MLAYETHPPDLSTARRLTTAHLLSTKRRCGAFVRLEDALAVCEGGSKAFGASSKLLSCNGHHSNLPTEQLRLSRWQQPRRVAAGRLGQSKDVTLR